MASTQDGTNARERLLAAAIEHVSQHGVGEISLRGLAAALGTSHRMLIYHFGSREALLIEVIRTVEEQQRMALAAILEDADMPPAEIMRRMWAPRRRPGAVAERAPVLRGLRPGAAGEPARAAAARRHRRRVGRAAGGAGRTRPPKEEARAEARLGVAVVRGLLLDLLATGDREAVDAAMERYISAIAPA